MNLPALINQLVVDEGLRLKPYVDTVGKTTIGIGRNLDDVGISREEAFVMAATDVAHVAADLDRALPWWRQMTDARQNALANMAFNLGITRLLGFANTLALLKAGRFDAAASEMLNSKWAGQVGARATRLAKVIREGVL